MTTPLNEIPAEDFSPLVGKPLSCRIANGDFELSLEAVEISPYPSGRELPGFSLYLRGPLDPALGQGTITLEHPSHGELVLFMTPVSRDASGMRYEIVFN